MNFAEILYQAALFTVTFFIFNRLFNRYVFKNRQEQTLSLSTMFFMASFYVFLSMGIQYFGEKYGLKPSQETQNVPVLQSGQSMPATVSTGSDVQAPLKTTIDFPFQATTDAELTTVTTSLGKYVFSSYAATIQSIDLFWENNETVSLLNQSNQNFALAFDQKSPINFEFKKHFVRDNGDHEVVYQTKIDHVNVEKVFIIHDKTYQIDLNVHVSGFSEAETIRLLMPTPAIADQLRAIVNSSKSTNRIKIDSIALDKNANFLQFWFEPKIFGFVSHYFTIACFAYSPISLGRGYLKAFDTGYQAILESKMCQGDVELSWSVYCGPNSSKKLAAVSPVLENIVDYGMLSVLAKPLAWFLQWIKDYVGSYGWAIILLTILLKLVLIPFALKGERGMREQAEFEKKRQHLQQKYKHDKTALDQAMAELIGKHGLPMFSGCLPMLLSLPILIALNKVLSTSTELYGATFLWIPDLSHADPYYILSFATFLSMLFVPGMQQNAGPRQMFSKFAFALLVAAVTVYVASGLALFILINTLFGVVQAWITSYFKPKFVRR